MPTRPTPTLADRAALTRGSPDNNVFAGEGFPGDNFDIAAFLRGGDLVRIEDAPVADVVAAAARPAAAVAIDLAAAQAPLPIIPPLGQIAEAGVLPDRLISADRVAGSADAPTPPPAADVIPGLNPISTIQGGPLTVQLDPERGVATPIAGVTTPVASVPPVSAGIAATRGAGLDWAPTLEAQGGTANIHLPVFDTAADAGHGLLVDLYAIPPLPPITPPNGDGLGA